MSVAVVRVKLVKSRKVCAILRKNVCEINAYTQLLPAIRVSYLNDMHLCCCTIYHCQVCIVLIVKQNAVCLRILGRVSKFSTLTPAHKLG